MPQFIKMGLHTTGFMGYPGSSKRSTQKCMQRRKVLAGFPIEEPFKTIEAIREYLAGDKLVCLLCGKSYKKIGTHIQRIHGMTVDLYKQKYKIPWTYGLVCKETHKNYSNAIRKRMNEGWIPPMKFGIEHDQMINAEKRKCPFKREISIKNLGDEGKPKRPLIKLSNGEYETFTMRRERLTAKRGTPEFKEKMLKRPQCQPDVTRERLGTYWKGRKQSEEHIRKRFAKKNSITI